MQYLKHHSLRDPADFDTPVPVALEELATPNRTVSDVSLEVMLNQAGYLTIKKPCLIRPSCWDIRTERSTTPWADSMPNR